MNQVHDYDSTTYDESESDIIDLDDTVEDFSETDDESLEDTETSLDNPIFGTFPLFLRRLSDPSHKRSFASSKIYQRGPQGKVRTRQHIETEVDGKRKKYDYEKVLDKEGRILRETGSPIDYEIVQRDFYRDLENIVKPQLRSVPHPRHKIQRKNGKTTDPFKYHREQKRDQKKEKEVEHKKTQKKDNDEGFNPLKWITW